MADYTIRNLKELDDLALQRGLAPQLEARFARTPLELRNFGFSYQKLAPGFRLPFGHRHGQQEEAYLVLEGSVRMKLEDEVVELGQWDAIRVPGSVMRGLEAGPDGVELLAIGAPAAQDAEVEQGWWAE